MVWLDSEIQGTDRLPFLPQVLICDSFVCSFIYFQFFHNWALNEWWSADRDDVLWKEPRIYVLCCQEKIEL